MGPESKTPEKGTALRMISSSGSASPRIEGVVDFAVAPSLEGGSVASRRGTLGAAEADPPNINAMTAGATHTKRRAIMARLLGMRTSVMPLTEGQGYSSQEPSVSVAVVIPEQPPALSPAAGMVQGNCRLPASFSIKNTFPVEETDSIV